MLLGGVKGFMSYSTSGCCQPNEGHTVTVVVVNRIKVRLVEIPENTGISSGILTSRTFVVV